MNNKQEVFQLILKLIQLIFEYIIICIVLYVRMFDVPYKHNEI